jgi:hypothetical protein
MWERNTSTIFIFPFLWDAINDYCSFAIMYCYFKVIDHNHDMHLIFALILHSRSSWCVEVLEITLQLMVTVLQIKQSQKIVKKKLNSIYKNELQKTVYIKYQVLANLVLVLNRVSVDVVIWNYYYISDSPKNYIYRC